MNTDDLRYLDERFKGINDKLDRIEEHVKVTNGRVTRLEDEKLKLQHYIDTHPVTCPNLDKIKDATNRIDILEKKLEDAMFFVRHPKLFIAGISLIVILSIATFLTNNPLKVFDKSPTPIEYVQK